MKTLLEKYEDKKSFKNEIKMIPIYIDKSGNRDIDLASLIRKQNELTINVKSSTGFNEIGTYNYPIKHPFNKTKYNMKNINIVCNQLIGLLEEYIRKVWNPKDFHLFFCSGGTDSRIISLILKKLRDVGFDLGEFLILCHGEEIPIFLKAMKEQKWKKNKYLVYKKDRRKSVDYYNWGLFDHNMNSYYAPLLDFYTDVLKERGLNSEEVSLISHRVHGMLYWHHLYYGRQTRIKNVKRLIEEKPFGRLMMLEHYTTWKDTITPCLYWKYLDFSFQTPDKFHAWAKPQLYGGSLPLELIRTTMLKLLGNKTDVMNWRAKYNFKFSQKTRKRIKKDWENSQLYKDFPEVRKYKPDKDMFSVKAKKFISCRLYGLATCYEVATNEKL